MIQLDAFKVLKKLAVKDIRIEPKKVRAVYSVENFAGELQSTELIYSYEQPFFDPKKAEDINLACIMLVQVAFNYGLFFEQIEFDGLFDAADRSFIREMIENTSREIITNKLSIKNEFLKAPFDTLQVENRSVYTQAEIFFSNTQFAGYKNNPVKQKPDYDKYLILSSGGKDSLLTYGLVKEFGEPHPVFINEAGRHWFTAVNSYRHYKATEPNTVKPWCNSDRVFNWMLKQLPFIRENYASIRSDIYPIRLWTVAVFLFGTLPVALKRGIGNILIGDEYDTTVTASLKGIKHYHGLYDQSKYFDNALTRYFHKKGWAINQFSLLRSMSELLIMKALIKRYPELQKQQISCHAAHEVNGRMHPCGKCEKCRRIIGMMCALDEDPQNCGYSPDQISRGLQALEKQSVKQIGSDAAHLYHLLITKKLIGENSFTLKAARRHDEITALRFDRERSNLEDMPQYVRRPLFNILQKYSNGAVKRSDNTWISFEPDDHYWEEKEYKLQQNPISTKNESV